MLVTRLALEECLERNGERRHRKRVSQRTWLVTQQLKMHVTDIIYRMQEIAG